MNPPAGGGMSLLAGKAGNLLIIENIDFKDRPQLRVKKSQEIFA
jgi:hypothetical protein